MMMNISGGCAFTYDETSQSSARYAKLWSEYGYGPWVAVDKVSGQFAGRIGLNLLADWPGPLHGSVA